MSAALGAVALTVTVLAVVLFPLAAVVLGGRVDDRNEQDAAREKHYQNLDGNHRPGRTLR